MLNPDTFRHHLSADFPFLLGKKLLVGVSGGIDSMALAELLRVCGTDFSIAHCNFKLRRKESDDDADFVRSYGENAEIRTFVTAFDTHSFASDQKLSIQMAARELRYAWFGELRVSHGFDFILTAHHADDDIETFFINLSRGSGLDGLSGIPRQNGFIARPLLAFSKNDIETFARECNLTWREDASNASGNYLRNRIRRELLPVLDRLEPHFRQSIQKAIANLDQAQYLVADAAHLVYKEIAVELPHKTLFRIPELKRLPHYRAYLYQWLKPYGFTAWEDIYALVDAPSGKQVFSESHIIAKDRETLELRQRVEDGDGEFSIDEGQYEFSGNITLSIERVDNAGENNESHIFVDRDTLRFPLVLRHWRQGDRFRPIGMSGTKKVGKYFKDGKFPLSDKENTWLLCSDDDIVWIVGHRAADQFKITPHTKNILRITAS